MVPAIKLTLLLLLVLTCTFSPFGTAAKPIHDPRVDRKATVKEIKKAYRKLSLTHHPDKSKEANATEIFRTISKAYEVLEGNESRSLFDYYLDHPRDYFKVSGTHYFRNLPKADVRLVLLIVIGLITWLIYSVKLQRYEKFVKKLKDLVIEEMNAPKSAEDGDESIKQLFERALEHYGTSINAGRPSDDQLTVSKSKVVKDPNFIKFIEKAVREVKVEGGDKKPEVTDLFAVQLVLLPYTLFKWLKKMHRRYISSKPFTDEEKEELALETFGFSRWSRISPEDRARFIEMEIWKSDVYDRWQKEQYEALRAQQMMDYDDDEEEFDDLAATAAAAAAQGGGKLSRKDLKALNKAAKKAAKKSSKKSD